LILPGRRILAGLALIAASAALASCARARETRGQFEAIDRAVGELDLAALGTLRLDERLGRVGFAQHPPTRVLVLEQDGRSAAAAVGLAESTLRRAGYDAEYFNGSCGTASPCHFRRPADNVTVGLVVYRPGQPVRAPTPDAPKYDATVPEDGVVTSLTFANQ
jgi:hypothetical protein